jgi:hypothetical protein
MPSDQSHATMPTGYAVFAIGWGGGGVASSTKLSSGVKRPISSTSCVVSRSEHQTNEVL